MKQDVPEWKGQIKMHFIDVFSPYSILIESSRPYILYLKYPLDPGLLQLSTNVQVAYVAKYENGYRNFLLICDGQSVRMHEKKYKYSTVYQECY